MTSLQRDVHDLIALARAVAKSTYMMFRIARMAAWTLRLMTYAELRK